MSDNVAVLASGQSIAQSLRIECRLGGGSASAVYGATSHTTGERYAIRCWLTADAKLALRATEKFMQRARETKLFDNPHIVEVFGTGELDGATFAISEWLEGTTLERLLRRQGTLSIEQVATLLTPCMYALAEAHEAGIVHGDVRPGNVFICRAAGSMPERARLLNFECGCVSDEPHAFTNAWRRDAFRDSQPFVSPEVLEGSQLDVRSDVYAFGALLYRALSGVLPFKAVDSDALAREIAAGEFVPLGQRVSHVAPEVIRVIERAMSKQPEERYGSLRDMAQDLSDAIGELPLRTPQTSVFYDSFSDEAVRERARPSRTGLIAVSLCVVSLLLCVFALVHDSRAPSEHIKHARSLARRAESVHRLQTGVLAPRAPAEGAVALAAATAPAELPAGVGTQVSASASMDPGRVAPPVPSTLDPRDPASIAPDTAGQRPVLIPDIPVVPPVVFSEPAAAASVRESSPAAKAGSATRAQANPREAAKAARRVVRKQTASAAGEKHLARPVKRALVPSSRSRGKRGVPSSVALRRRQQAPSSAQSESADDALDQMRLQ